MMRGLLSSLLLVLFSCSSSVPSGILPPDKMYLAMKDIIKVDELINNLQVKDSTIDPKVRRSTLYEQVFTMHSTTRVQFYKSYRYYQQHPDKQKQIFDSLSAAFQKKEALQKPASGRQSTPNDSLKKLKAVP